jgi:ComF family protein
VNPRGWASKIGHALLDLLYPIVCVGCRQPGTLYCPDCRESVRRVAPPLCPLCGTPQDKAELCPRCARNFSDERPSPIDGMRAVAYLEGSMREAIHALKYDYIRGLAVPLGEMLAEYYRNAPLPADVIVPVPLHRRRKRERGYNQSALLAQQLGSAVQIPVRLDLLRRHRYTRSQTRLNPQQRSQNVHGAFSCASLPGVVQAIAGQRLLLVDDVLTTGATLRECAQVLRDCGARSIWALTLARAVPDQRSFSV